MNNLSNLLQAAKFAAKQHDGQRRKGADAEPYIVHPLDVAYLLTDIGKVEDYDILIAAVLHDTVEDTATTNQEIVKRFGENVASIVAEVTDDTSLEKEEQRAEQVRHAPHMSVAAKQLKMCDKISNIADVMENPAMDWDQQKKLDYIEWGERVFAGLRGVNKNLEDHFDKLVATAKEKIKKGENGKVN